MKVYFCWIIIKCGIAMQGEWEWERNRERGGERERKKHREKENFSSIRVSKKDSDNSKINFKSSENFVLEQSTLLTHAATRTHSHTRSHTHSLALTQPLSRTYPRTLTLFLTQGPNPPTYLFFSCVFFPQVLLAWEKTLKYRVSICKLFQASKSTNFEIGFRIRLLFWDIKKSLWRLFRPIWRQD